jgi:hypothetical protein
MLSCVAALKIKTSATMGHRTKLFNTIPPGQIILLSKPGYSRTLPHGPGGDGVAGKSACTQGRLHLQARRSGRGRITSVHSGDEPCKCPAQVRAVAGNAILDRASTKNL